MRHLTVIHGITERKEHMINPYTHYTIILNILFVISLHLQ